MGSYDGAHRQLRSAPPGKRFDPSELRPLDFGTEFGSDNLFRVFRHFKSEEEKAPGIDGIAFSKVSIPEGAENCRRLAEWIGGSAYQPGRTRDCPIPKGENDTRILAIPPIMDRVVARAAYEALCPYAERVFSQRSYGYRPGRTAYQMLAEIVRGVGGGARPYVGSYDITAAFDSVLIKPIIEAFATLLDESSMRSRSGGLRWRTMLRTILNEGTDRVRGIGTGSPFSPLALNVALHYLLDIKLTDAYTTPWLRWADNIIFIADNPEAVQTARAFAERQLRRLGVSLHGEHTDLQDGGCATILGFTLNLADRRVKFGIDESSWRRLARELPQIHRLADPPQRLQETLQGWIEAYGPALAAPDEVINRLVEVASQTTGLIPCRAELQQHAVHSNRKWEGLLRRALSSPAAVEA